MTPLGSRTWQARSPQSSDRIGMVMATPSDSSRAAAGTAHGAAYEPEHAYAFGLQLILDGLSALIGDAAS